MSQEIQPMQQQTEATYTSVRSTVISAQNRVYAAINTAMVQAYWEIGEQIYKACGENDRAGYGKNLLQYLSDRLTAEFGKGYTVSNLRNMRQFFLMFPKRYALRSELSWTHYRLLMRVPDEKARSFIWRNAPNPRGAPVSWSARSTPCTISVCLPVRTRHPSPQKYKPRGRSRNMKRQSRTPM